MGGEAIKDALSEMDLLELKQDLELISTTTKSKQKREDALKRLKVVKDFARDRNADVRRGPIRSKAPPTGICIKAKDRNQRPDAVDKSSGVTPMSCPKIPVKTAKKLRKNWLST